MMFCWLPGVKKGDYFLRWRRVTVITVNTINMYDIVDDAHMYWETRVNKIYSRRVVRGVGVGAAGGCAARDVPRDVRGNPPKYYVMLKNNIVESREKQK